MTNPRRRPRLLPLALLAMAIWPVGPAFAAPYRDQGIWNEFHRAHLGQVVFSEGKIVHNAPDERLIRDTFDLTRPMKARLYLPSSIANFYDSLGPAYGKDVQISLGGRLLVDGQEKAKWPFLFVGNMPQRETWTTWYYDLVAETPRPWNAVSQNEVENWFGEVVESLPPGPHTLRLEFTARKADGSDGPIMAAGECQLSFTAAQKAAWVAKYGAQILFVQPGFAGPYHVTIANECGHNVSYRIQRADKSYNETMGADQNVSVGLSTGDQIILDGRPLHIISAASQGQTVTLCR